MRRFKQHLMKGISLHGNGKWRVSIMVNAERMTKVCYSYDEAVQTVVYFRSILNLKHQGLEGDSMFTLNQNGQVVNEGQIMKRNASNTPATAAWNASAATTPQTFTFPATGQGVRIIEKDGQPWFVAGDVCSLLGTDPKDIPVILDADEHCTLYTIEGRNNSTGLRKDTRMLSESGMYALVLKSRKPEARAFSKWVRAEVLPAIRRTGGYMLARPDDTPEELLSRALIIAKEALERHGWAFQHCYHIPLRTLRAYRSGKRGKAAVLNSIIEQHIKGWRAKTFQPYCVRFKKSRCNCSVQFFTESGL